MNDNLADTPASREHPELRNAHGSPPARPDSRSPAGAQHSPGETAIWLAIYFLAAGLSAGGAILIAQAVDATGMETAAAGGGAFLAVMALTISVHRFLQDR